jgi:nucleoid-associated protein YgaU
MIMLEIVALAVLVDMGTASWAQANWRNPDLWFATAGAADAVAAALRLFAVCGVGWLLAATVLDVVLVAASATRSTRLRVPGLPAGLRRRIEASVAALVATSTLAAPAVAVAAPGLPAHIPVPVPHEVVATHDRVEPPVAPTDPSTSEPRSQDRSAPGAARYTVAVGDHLWGIAERVVTDVRGDATTADVAAYWRELIAANEDLPSGDPDLIHPGQQVRLPPL